MKPFSVILLAGGTGSRMKAEVPKQYLQLNNKHLVLHSFDFFKNFPHVLEIIIVCEPSYHSLFETDTLPIKFALPGKRRQDSVYNGLNEVDPESSLVCVHDSARPFLNESTLQEAIKEADLHGASTLAVPLKFSVKEIDAKGFIKESLDRSKIFEIQTPQVIKTDLFKEGFKHILENSIEVTDDVSLVELLKKPVKFVMGSYENIKITTAEDLIFAEKVLDKKNVF